MPKSAGSNPAAPATTFNILILLEFIKFSPVFSGFKCGAHIPQTELSRQTARFYKKSGNRLCTLAVCIRSDAMVILVCRYSGKLLLTANGILRVGLSSLQDTRVALAILLSDQWVVDLQKCHEPHQVPEMKVQ